MEKCCEDRVKCCVFWEEFGVGGVKLRQKPKAFASYFLGGVTGASAPVEGGGAQRSAP